MNNLYPDSVCVITVNWNDLVNTADCLDSLQKIQYPYFKIIVVDNGSRKNIRQELIKRYPGVIFLHNEKNFGLAYANNVGLRYALAYGAEYCLLLNNDTTVHPQVLEEFVQAARRYPQAGILGAKIYYHADPCRIWWAAPQWDFQRSEFVNFGCNVIDDGRQFVESHEIFYANGCAFFVRACVIKKVGLMDERFFIYFEEIDFCSRARNAGYHVRFVPTAKVWHKVAASSGGDNKVVAAYFETRNQLLWARKHLPQEQKRKVIYRMWKSFLFFTLYQNRYPAWKRLHWDIRALCSLRGRAKAFGMWDYYRGKFGNCPAVIRRMQNRANLKHHASVRKFCTRPFEWLEIQGRKAYLCCPGWITIGSIDMKSGVTVQEAWNSQKARDFRASILDGSFRYCRRDACIFLNQKENVPYWESGGSPLKSIREITDPRLLEIIDKKLIVLKDGPLSLNCGYDRSCNLSCPSCRDSVIALKEDALASELEFQERLMSQVGKGLKLLYVSGTGDPFASAVYRNLLRNLSPEDFPEMQIHLGTNALFWTPSNWEAMRKIHPRITSAHISIDAANPKTYAINRRGGDWDTLMANLEFVSQLRRMGPLRFVTISFVVQQNNYRQMPDFIRMADRFGFDLAYFHKFQDWGSYSPAEYRTRAVHLSLHPEHHKFLEVLSQPCFNHPKAGLYCLIEYRKKALRIHGRIGGFKMLGLQIKALRILDAVCTSIFELVRKSRRKLKKLNFRRLPKASFPPS